MGYSAILNLLLFFLLIPTGWSNMQYIIKAFSYYAEAKETDIELFV